MLPSVTFGAPANSSQEALNDFFRRSLQRLQLATAGTDLGSPATKQQFGNLYMTGTGIVWASTVAALSFGITDIVGNYSHQISFGLNNGATLQLVSSQATSPGAAPGLIHYFNKSVAGVAGDGAGTHRFYSKNSAGAAIRFAAMFVNVITATAGAEDGQLQWKVASSGNTTIQAMNLGGAVGGGGLQLGSGPTGGDKGLGTLNVQTGVYLNGTAYTNPDYALEHYFTGDIVEFANNPGAKNYLGLMPLDDVEDYLMEHFRLPGIHRECMDIFERADIALEKIEQTWLYITQLHKRIRVLEAQLGER